MSTDDQAMLVIDLEFPEMPEKFRTAALLTVKAEQIHTIEIFFDTGALTTSR